jgi:isopenicillin N synthase-like dioxygenase
MTVFDPVAKANALADESMAWDTSSPADAKSGDIPVVDVSPYLTTGSRGALETAAALLNDACENVGFYQLVGHGLPSGLIGETFDQVRRFHALPLEAKQQILMDRPEFPVGGVGYMPLGSRKLPTRAKGNLNEAFLIKGTRTVHLDDNQWLAEQELPGFRDAVKAYATAVSSLALRLLPIYAVALGLHEDFFAPGFSHPFWRLRMTHYPADAVDPNDVDMVDGFGIAPHVDTTFFTLLLQDGPGLSIYSAKRQEWIKAPVMSDAFVVNSGELLKQWSNDRYLSTRHFANNSEPRSRYSIPFFYNATADYPMECLPTCHGPGNPPKYPTISYLQSQGVVQGE